MAQRTDDTVVREQGENWDASVPMRKPRAVGEARYSMDAFVDDGCVVLGGPLGDGEKKFLLIIVAESEQASETRIVGEPWTALLPLRTAAVECWEISLKASKEQMDLMVSGSRCASHEMSIDDSDYPSSL